MLAYVKGPFPQLALLADPWLIPTYGLTAGLIVWLVGDRIALGREADALARYEPGRRDERGPAWFQAGVEVALSQLLRKHNSEDFAQVAAATSRDQEDWLSGRWVWVIGLACLLPLLGLALGAFQLDETTRRLAYALLFRHLLIMLAEAGILLALALGNMKAARFLVRETIPKALAYYSIHRPAGTKTESPRGPDPTGAEDATEVASPGMVRPRATMLYPSAFARELDKGVESDPPPRTEQAAVPRADPDDWDAGEGRPRSVDPPGPPTKPEDAWL
jgi:hypothetical protein